MDDALAALTVQLIELPVNARLQNGLPHGLRAETVGVSSFLKSS